MNIPDKMFAAYEWREICVYMFVKRHLADGALKVSYQCTANEFGMTKGKVRHLIGRMVSEGFLPSGLRQSVVPSSVQNEVPSRIPSGKTTTERAKVFYNSLVPYVQQYGKKMVREFYDYWSETNASGKKMRFEMQQTWSLQHRLARWAGNNNINKRKHDPHSDGTILHAGQMDYEKDGW